MQLIRTWRPGTAHRPRFAGAVTGTVRLRWLGTACFVVETDETTIVIDPFVSRPSARSVVFRPLVPDLLEIGRHFPRKVDAVVCGHSHYDHLLDGPALAAATGARFIGSPTSIHIARAAGVLEEQLVSVPAPPASVKVGDVSIRLVPSLHGRFILRRFYLADGTLDRPPQLPARASTYKMGGAFGVFIEAPGLTVYHNGSADLVDAALDGIRADVLLVGLAGRQGTRDYLGRLVRALEPSVVVPTHHDLFFSPLDEGLRLLPLVDLDGFVDESHRLAPKATLVLPSYHETIVVPRGEPRGAGITDGGRTP